MTLTTVTGGDPLERIAAALERMSPQPAGKPDFSAQAFVWHTGPDRLEPVAKVNRVDVSLLVGVDRARDTLIANTRQFASDITAQHCTTV